MSTDLHAVFATDGDGNTYRVSDPLAWNAAQNEWDRLDTDHREGLLPQAKFFEVRSVTLGPDRPIVGPEVRSHDRYDRATLDLTFTKRVTSFKGFASVERAAHRAWMELTGGQYTSRKRFGHNVETYVGEQGRGGWFYYPNGQTAAQGLTGLARLAQSRKMVVQGVGGRWYPVAQETL